VINYNLKREVFIEKYFRLGPPSSKGWKQNYTGCPYCNDGRSNNPRSHFIFSEDGIGWQCFNCSRKHRFTENNINYLAKFISKSAWKKVGSILLEIKKEKLFPASNLKNQDDIKDEVGEDNLKLIDYKEVDLPGVSIPFNMKISEIAPNYRNRFKSNKSKAIEYLKDHCLYKSTKINELYICLEGKYNNRLIFPIYFDGSIVSWTARALFPTKTKFLYPPSTKDYNDRGTIIYGLDNLFKAENVKQLFVTESLTDAILLNGMAVLSKNITEEQITILKTFNLQNKKLIFVLDKDKINFKWDIDLKGITMGKIVLNEKQKNWFVSYPKFSNPAKDVSESYHKFGWLETYDKIMSGVVKSSTDLTLKSKLLNFNVGKRKRKLLMRS